METGKSGGEFPPSEVINRLRRQMVVHSYIYYRLDQILISDDEWQERAERLAKLQEEHGTKHGYLDKVFEFWDGTTGMHLPCGADEHARALAIIKVTEEARKEAAEAGSTLRRMGTTT